VFKIDCKVSIKIKINIAFDFKISCKTEVNFIINFTIEFENDGSPNRKCNVDTKREFTIEFNFKCSNKFRFRNKFKFKNNIDTKINFTFEISFVFIVNAMIEFNCEISFNVESKINYSVKPNTDFKSKAEFDCNAEAKPIFKFEYSLNFEYNFKSIGGFHMAKKIAITENKGGVGKTITAINLSAVLAQAGNKILVIDCDPQGNGSDMLGVESEKLEFTLYQLLMNTDQDLYDDLLSEVLIHTELGIDLLPANIDLVNFEINVLLDDQKYKRSDIYNLLERAVKPIEEKYDFILFDTPPGFGIMSGNIMTYADDLVIPFKPEQNSVKGVKNTMYIAQKFMKRNPSLNVKGVLFTAVDMRTNLHKITYRATRDGMLAGGLPVLDTYIPNTIKYTEAGDTYHKPLVSVVDQDKSYKKFAKYYEDLAKELGYIGRED